MAMVKHFCSLQYWHVASIAVVLVHITILIQATPVALILVHQHFEEAFADALSPHTTQVSQTSRSGEKYQLPL
jgi:hypothetical protein